MAKKIDWAKRAQDNMQNLADSLLPIEKNILRKILRGKK